MMLSSFFSSMPKDWQDLSGKEQSLTKWLWLSNGTGDLLSYRWMKCHSLIHTNGCAICEFSLIIAGSCGQLVFANLFCIQFYFFSGSGGMFIIIYALLTSQLAYSMCIRVALKIIWKIQLVQNTVWAVLGAPQYTHIRSLLHECTRTRS